MKGSNAAAGRFAGIASAAADGVIAVLRGVDATAVGEEETVGALVVGTFFAQSVNENKGIPVMVCPLHVL